MYPWQSGSDGREENQQTSTSTRSRAAGVPDTTHRQRHVGIAVAYNVWQYYQATSDDDFLHHYGAEMILDIARFWASAAVYDHGRDRYDIRGVMGPDEFHTGYPAAADDGIDNNAYTNVMAAWVLLRALDVAGDRCRSSSGADQLARNWAWTAEEIWPLGGDQPASMFVPFHDGGIISQFEGYDELEELDWNAYRERYGDIQRLDRILEAEDDSPNRYKASKQADVLMLFYLLSADELRELLRAPRLPIRTPDRSRGTIDYYLARTSARFHAQ